MPIHTIYVGAHAFDASTPGRLVESTSEFFTSAVSDTLRIAEVFGLDAGLAADVHHRVTERLEASQAGQADQIVEDLRVDFEDGYCGRDRESDARRSALAAAEAHRAGRLPGGFGLRIHSMAATTRQRALGALDLFVGDLLAALGELPDGFVVTLAKIDTAEEVSHLADALDARELAWGLQAGSLRVELMAETPRSIYDAEGRLAIPGMVAAARGRCVGVHFGIYDYTASLGLVAGQQRLRHPACDVARGALQIGIASLQQAGLDIELSDGSSRIVPRLGAPGAGLDRSMRCVYDDVRHSLDLGIYRGWDMAPSHIALRWLAVTAFYLQHLPEMSQRWVDATAQNAGDLEDSDLEDSDLEDSATLTALNTFFRRGLACGALTPADLPKGWTR